MDIEKITEDIKTITTLASDLLTKEQVEKLRADLINGAGRYFQLQADRKLNQLQDKIYNQKK